MGRRAHWRDLAIIALGSTVLFTLASGRRDLWNPNEPTYGQAVAEMAARGDWVIPTVNGVAFAEKPILYYWLALAAARALGGVGESALRLPAAAAGVATVVLAYVLVWPYAGARRARLTAAILAGTFIVFWSARQIQMDLLLCATTLAAVVATTRVVDHGLDPRRGLTLAGAACGLGLLAKGPLGLIVPPLALAPYLVAERRRLAPLARPWPLALAGCAALAVAAPWYLALWRDGHAALLSELLWRQNVTRFVAPWDHARPWWYYLAYFFVDLAPFAAFVPLAAGLREEDPARRSLARLAWGVLLAVVAFFSLSASKRSPYILPAAPAAAVLVAGVAERWLDGRLDRRRARAALAIAAALGTTLLGCALFLTRGPRRITEDQELRLVAMGLAAVAAAGGVGILGAALGSWRRRALPAAIAAATAALYLTAALWALPAANRFKSARTFCADVARWVGRDDPLRGFHEWTWRASYSFYLGRAIPNLESPEDLAAYWARPQRVFLIVERGRLDAARRVLGPQAPLAERAIGDNRAYLFSSRPPGGG